MKLIKLLILFASFSSSGFDAERLDLSDRWKKFVAETWQPYSLGSRVVHFVLKSNDVGILEINNNRKFNLFVDNNLVLIGQSAICLSVDSLKSVYVFPITISITSDQALDGLSTSLVHNSMDNADRSRANYSASVLTVLSFLLLSVLILLIFSNGAVIAEYFNFFKVFSIRSTDEGALIQRITSFNNVFIYGFLSVLIALNLITLDHGHGSFDFSSGSQNILMHVLKLSAIVMVILLVKIILVYVSSGFFKLSESAPNQFFNFVRLLLGFFTMISMVRLLIFVFNGEFYSWQPLAMVIFFGLLILFLVATFLKLYGKGNFNVFHLFSYICVSEIFPALFLLEYIIH